MWQHSAVSYPLAFFDALRVKVGDQDFVRNKAVYVALGTWRSLLRSTVKRQTGVMGDRSERCGTSRRWRWHSPREALGEDLTSARDIRKSYFSETISKRVNYRVRSKGRDEKGFGCFIPGLVTCSLSRTPRPPAKL